MFGDSHNLSDLSEMIDRIHRCFLVIELWLQLWQIFMCHHEPIKCKNYMVHPGSAWGQLCGGPLAATPTSVLMKCFTAFCCPTWGFTSLSLPSLDVIAMAGLGALLFYQTKTCGNFLPVELIHYCGLCKLKQRLFSWQESTKRVQDWWSTHKT